MFFSFNFFVFYKLNIFFFFFSKTIYHKTKTVAIPYKLSYVKHLNLSYLLVRLYFEKVAKRLASTFK